MDFRVNLLIVLFFLLLLGTLAYFTLPRFFRWLSAASREDDARLAAKLAAEAEAQRAEKEARVMAEEEAARLFQNPTETHNEEHHS